MRGHDYKVTLDNTVDTSMLLNTAAPSEKELKDWMSQFPPYLNKFVEGVSTFNGKVLTEFAPGVYPIMWDVLDNVGQGKGDLAPRCSRSRFSWR